MHENERPTFGRSFFLLISLIDTTKKPLSITRGAFLLIMEKLSEMMVGVTGFEPATTWSQTRCATGLRYAPIGFLKTDAKL